MLYNLPCLQKAAQNPMLRRYIDACLAYALTTHLEGEAFVARTQAHVPGVLGPAAVLRRLRRCQMRALRVHVAAFHDYQQFHRIDVSAFESTAEPTPYQRPVDTQGVLWFLYQEKLDEVLRELIDAGRGA